MAAAAPRLGTPEVPGVSGAQKQQQQHGDQEEAARSGTVRRRGCRGGKNRSRGPATAAPVDLAAAFKLVCRQQWAAFRELVRATRAPASAGSSPPSSGPRRSPDLHKAKGGAGPVPANTHAAPAPAAAEGAPPPLHPEPAAEAVIGVAVAPAHAQAEQPAAQQEQPAAAHAQTRAAKSPAKSKARQDAKAPPREAPPTPVAHVHTGAQATTSGSQATTSGRAADNMDARVEQRLRTPGRMVWWWSPGYGNPPHLLVAATRSGRNPTIVPLTHPRYKQLAEEADKEAEAH